MKHGNLFGQTHFSRAKRSTHNLSEARHLTTHPGQCRIAYSRRIYPADRFKIDPMLYIESFPTVIPFRGSFEARLDYFFVPDADFYGWIDNDTQITFQQYLKMPRFTFTPNLFGVSSASIEGQVSSAYAPGSLMDMMGNPTVPEGYFTISEPPVSGSTSAHAITDAAEFLSFWAIYRKFYLNPQETTFPVCGFKKDDTGTPQWGFTYLSNAFLDYLPAECRRATMYTSDNISSVPHDLFLDRTALFGEAAANPALTRYLTSALGQIGTMQTLFDGGIPLCTYRMDYFRGRLNTSTGAFQSVVTSSDANITINNIRYANKIQKLADRFTPSSGRFSDFVRAIWPSKVKAKHGPQYLGGFSTSLEFNSVFQTSSSTTGDTPLGWKVQNIQSSRKGRNIYLKTDTYGTILGILTIRPLVTYDQILWPEKLRVKWGDMYTPELANLGYQTAPNYELAPYNTSESSTLVQDAPIGQRLSWVDLRTAVDRTYGLFRWPYNLHQMFANYFPGTRPSTITQAPLTLNYSTYVDPSAWNSLFAATGAFDHNFMVSVYNVVKASRTIPYSTTPSL